MGPRAQKKRGVRSKRSLGQGPEGAQIFVPPFGGTKSSDPDRFNKKLL